MLDRAKVNAIRAALRAGETVPPIEVSGSKGFGLVFDGHHRLAAYKAEGIKNIPVNVVSSSHSFNMYGVK